MHKKLLTLAILRERGRGQRQEGERWSEFKSHTINKLSNIQNYTFFPNPYWVYFKVYYIADHEESFNKFQILHTGHIH